MEENDPDEVDHNLATVAVYINSYKSIDPWIQSTGFRTNDLRYRALSHSKDTRIAEEFLVNTRLTRNNRESEVSTEGYFMDAGVVMLSMMGQEEKAGYREISLPEGVGLQMELGEVIARRRSSRGYTGDAMELDCLATILRSANGITCLTSVSLFQGGQSTLHFRSIPSGGGLYPVDLYAAALNVNGLDRGIYLYDPSRDTLLQTGDQSSLNKLLLAFAVSEDIISFSRANVIFLLVGRPWKSMRKYGNRGMRFLFLEAGAMAEHIDLATVALGFGSVDCAAVYDDEVHEAMELDGLYQTLIHTVIVGYPG